MAGSWLRNLYVICHVHICKHVPIHTELQCRVRIKSYRESSITNLTKELSRYLGSGFFWTVFFEVSIGQLVNKMPAFYRIQNFVTALKIALHRCLAWANRIQYTLWKISVRLFVRLFSHLLPGTQTLSFPTELMCAFIPPMHSTWTACFLSLQLTSLGMSAKSTTYDYIRRC